MPPGTRASTGSDWPYTFHNSLDFGYARGTVLDGYMTTDRQGDTTNSTKMKWRLTSKVGLVRGPYAGGHFATPWYACSIWEIQDPDPMFPNKGNYLRCSTFPNSGPRREKHLFRSFNAVKDNSYSILQYADYIKLRESRQAEIAALAPSDGSPSGSSNSYGYTGSADTIEARINAANAIGEFGVWSSDAFLGGLDSLARPGTGTGGRGGSGGTNDTQPSTAYALDSAVRLVVRMPIGYAGVAKSASRAPGFVQTWQAEDGNIYTEEFLFRYIPQNIKYDGLASEWVEIPRAENIPYVDWARWQLMKVSMSFLIASDRIEPGGQSVPDGMQTAVEPEIQKLRQMAQRKVPITFINMDELLTVQLRRGIEAGKGLEFVINDMSVTATRRVTDFTDGYAGVPSGIAVAQVEMTFTEVPVETVALVMLPPIGAPPLPVPQTPKPNDTPLTYQELSLVATKGLNRVTTVYTSDAP